MNKQQDKIKMIKAELDKIQVPGFLCIDFSNPDSVERAYDLIRTLRPHEETIGYMD